MSGRPEFLFWAFAAFLLLFFPYQTDAGVPTDKIRETVDKTIAILRNPRLKPQDKTKERRQLLRQAIYPRFDFAEMAKRSLGANWRRRTPQEQREFVAIFTDLLENSYVTSIESYSGEKYTYTKESVSKEYAEVDSKFNNKQGEEISIIYKLYLVNGDWKVYDVVVENISLVNNYRSQFNRVIANSSYEELVRRLKQKQTELARGARLE
ncbi:MAG: ABC transporter substrate-binding protein [Deltaproteobacteria bacterium]|nr:ABC transporter substrate-binding protein [Deltaproteobacteria bacterium]